MKLKISTIPLEGADFDFAIDSHQLRTFLNEEDSIKNAVKKPVEVHLNAQKIRDNITLKGEFYTEMEPVCDRCLETFELTVNGNVDINCIPTQKVADEDEGVLPYSSDIIDLAKVIHTQVMLGIPMTLHCKESCKGLCSSCGHNLNTGPCPQHGNSDKDAETTEESANV